MRTISIINLKGGVAKTISSLAIGHILATEYGKRVLLVDNDKQGDCSRGLGRRTESGHGIDKLLTETDPDTKAYIQHTDYQNLDIITANMNLLLANKEVMYDQMRPQQNRLKKALDKVADQYDFCIIDNAPDINISVVNTLVAADDVLIPIKIDYNSTEGMEIITEQIEIVKENMNPNLQNVFCFMTMYDKKDKAHVQGEQLLRAGNQIFMHTKIRASRKVSESTYQYGPITHHSPQSAAAKDYKKLVREYFHKTGLKENVK